MVRYRVRKSNTELESIETELDRKSESELGIGRRHAVKKGPFSWWEHKTTNSYSIITENMRGK